MSPQESLHLGRWLTYLTLRYVPSVKGFWDFIRNAESWASPTAMKLLLPSHNIPQVIPLCAKVENTVLNEIGRNFYS